MTWSCPVCGTVTHDNRRKCTTRNCLHPGGPASTWQNSGKVTRNSRRAPSSSASRRWTCQACSYENCTWRDYCHSCKHAVSSVCRVGSGGDSSRRPPQSTTFSEFLSAGCDKLRGGSESLGSDAMLSAKTEKQDRLKALDTNIENLKKARGGPVSSTPIVTTSAGSNFRAAKAPFPSQRAAPYALGFQSGRRADFECSHQPTARWRASRTSAFSGSARATADAAEQAFEACTMADFSRRVPLDVVRGRGLMKGLQPEILEQISSWPSAQARGCEACTQLIAYTDGSACTTRAWPRLTPVAGWGAVIFALDASGVWSLGGGAWRPVETDPAA